MNFIFILSSCVLDCCEFNCCDLNFMSYIEIYRMNIIFYQTFTKSNAISTTKPSTITRTFITTTNPKITSPCSTCTHITGSKTYGLITTQQNTRNSTTEKVAIRKIITTIEILKQNITLKTINETNLVLIPHSQNHISHHLIQTE